MDHIMRAPTRKPVVSFGLWPSPIAAGDVARVARRFGMLQGDGDWVYWTEGRPEENGRQVLLRARPGSRVPEELLPAFVTPANTKKQPFVWSARSRVHEYGGGEFLAAGDRVFFVNDADQDIYELEPGGAPRRLTNEAHLRFADMLLDVGRARLIAVAERHRQGQPEPENLLVSVALAGRQRGAVTEFATGRDFYAAPQLSPDGTCVAFIAWDLPGMPWDEAGLYVAKVAADGTIGKPRRIAGGKGVAAAHPRYAPDGTLVFLSDENGWGNLYAWDGTAARALTQQKIEFGRPMWTFGTAPFAIDAESRIVAAPISTELAVGFGSRLFSLTTSGKDKRWHALAENQLDGLASCDVGVAALASASDTGATIRCYQVGDDYHETMVRAASEAMFEDVAKPELVTFKSADGAMARGFYYAPTSGLATAPRNTQPPALVLAHGGPTSMAGRGLSPRVQFYTSRGFAVLDVDYAGSTGYGRAYRERLDGKWGLADVADCAAGARFLGRRGLADPGRIAIAGGSAGGYTTLMALATTDVFAAGSSHYGISDLTLLMEHTHKFESGYLHRLLGTTPRSWKKTCRERSPLTLIDSIRSPLILFQELEDRVVPPEQSRLIAERLKVKGITVELHEFAGEAHGFRQAATIIAVLERELAFLVKSLRIA